MSIIMKWLYDVVQNLGKAILKFLPVSPFHDFISSWNPPEYIGWLNWFFPVREIIVVLSVWLTAVGLFYLYSIIMRWAKMIGD